jgi:hypothetical protein
MRDERERIVHRELATDAGDPSVQVAEVIAELEDVDPTDLTDTHSCIDDVLANIFSNPPSPDAQMQVTFSYEGYRVTVEQNGNAKFVKLDAS